MVWSDVGNIVFLLLSAPAHHVSYAEDIGRQHYQPKLFLMKMENSDTFA